MLPDVHAERGMTCAACHTMRSLQEGKRAARTCRDCHPAPSRSVPEHSFAAHLEKMECVACHAAWAPQEYGTFLVRAADARAGGGLRGAARLGPVAEERLPQEPGRAAAGAERARQGLADPAAVRAVRHRREPGLREPAARGGVEGLRPAHRQARDASPAAGATTRRAASCWRPTRSVSTCSRRTAWRCAPSGAATGRGSSTGPSFRRTATSR